MGDSSYLWDQGGSQGSKWGSDLGSISAVITPKTQPLYARARTMIVSNITFYQKHVQAGSGVPLIERVLGPLRMTHLYGDTCSRGCPCIHDMRRCTSISTPKMDPFWGCTGGPWILPDPKGEMRGVLVDVYGVVCITYATVVLQLSTCRYPDLYQIPNPISLYARARTMIWSRIRAALKPASNRGSI